MDCKQERTHVILLLQYLFLFLAILGLPINELTILLGDLTFSKPNSRTHEVRGRFGVALGGWLVRRWRHTWCDATAVRGVLSSCYCFRGSPSCAVTPDASYACLHIYTHAPDPPTLHAYLCMQQLEADEMGVHLCAKAGYDPAAAIRVSGHVSIHHSIDDAWLIIFRGDGDM